MCNMINIISDTCVGAALTRDVLKQQYINPFCWSIIDSHSMAILINEYDTLNYNNFIIKQSSKEKRFDLIIDNKIKILYEHYLYDSNINEFKVVKNNVYSKHIKEYIIEKYKKRLKLNNKPLFIIGHTYFPDKPRKSKYENIILKNTNNYPMIVILNTKNEFDYFKKYETDNIKIYLTNLKTIILN